MSPELPYTDTARFQLAAQDHCAICGWDQVLHDANFASNGVIVLEAQCDKCKGQWYEYYKMDHIKLRNRPNEV